MATVLYISQLELSVSVAGEFSKILLSCRNDEVLITTSREKYGSAVSSSSYISSSDSDSVVSGGVQVVDGVGVAR